MSMNQRYETPIVEEIIIAPMKSLLQDISNPEGVVPPSGDGGDE